MGAKIKETNLYGLKHNIYCMVHALDDRKWQIQFLCSVGLNNVNNIIFHSCDLQDILKYDAKIYKGTNKNKISQTCDSFTFSPVSQSFYFIGKLVSLAHGTGEVMREVSLELKTISDRASISIPRPFMYSSCYYSHLKFSTIWNTNPNLFPVTFGHVRGWMETS